MFVETLLTVLRVLAPLFLLILLGAFLRRKNLIPLTAIPVLNGLVVNVTLPALVVLSLANAPQLPPSYALATLCFLGANLATMGIAFAIGLACRLPRPLRGALMLTASFGNTGFLGYPITLARPLVAGIFPAAVLLDQFAMTLPLYLSAALVGGAFGGRSEASHPGTGTPPASSRRKTILRFFRSPIFLSMLLGLVARLLPWPDALRSEPQMQALGQITAQTLGYLGQGTTPIVLLALGAALRPGAVRRSPVPVALACGLKLFVAPLLAWGACHLAGVPGDLTALAVQMGAMPTAVVCSVLCTQNALEGDLAVGIVFASTALSAITIPLVISLLY
ncbi:MAG: AEC family transporter [Cytophagales bacterium]|nr:AEC family transporter [Armatimonadota bacterium]